MFWNRSSHPSEEELSEHVDGRLTGAQVRRVEEHLAQGAPCGETFQERRSVRFSLQRMEEAPPPRTIYVPAESRRSIPSWLRALPVLRVATAGAAALLVF